MPVTILIGLEVHVQLLTVTKLFCGCRTTFGMPANSQTCPVCIGMPGVLPVLNRRAFELAVKAALALDCEIARFTKWDRKNYYYPDLPKNYQISQYDLPFARGGGLTIPTEDGPRTIRLIRVHLEEDAGKNLHSESGGDSLIDLNRAGTPLLEIVTQPDLHRPREAAVFLESLRTMLRDQEISDCEMQEGSLRCDANINLHITKDGQVHKTPIVEIKNLNSIKSVERALEYEAGRQYDHWLADGLVMDQAPKQTRGWDEIRGVTRAMREKEEAADYRYFPEPDLIPVVVDDAWIAKLRAGFGETSDQRRRRFEEKLGLSAYNADVLVSRGRAVSDYFEALVSDGIEPKTAANWVLNDLLAHAVGRIKFMSQLPVPPDRLAGLIRLVASGRINLNDAREKVLPEMVRTSRSADELVRELGLEVVADLAAVEAVCDEVLREMPAAVQDVKSGKTKAMGAIVGQVMRRSAGKFPPTLINQVLAEKLAPNA
jgi:aspartyl-tRNA(Asn)/glutamyl-tRNA(Gln) amidotransferase subunit B